MSKDVQPGRVTARERDRLKRYLYGDGCVKEVEVQVEEAQAGRGTW